jgi:hypothetical protein
VVAVRRVFVSCEIWHMIPLYYVYSSIPTHVDQALYE